MRAIQLLQQRTALALGLSSDVFGAGGRVQIGDRRAAAGIDDRSLVRHGQKAGTEVAFLVVGQTARVRQHDERRQIVGLAAQRVTDPRAQARKAGQQKTGVHQVAAGTVHVRLRSHRHEESHVIDARRGVRQQAADPAAALAVLLELEGGFSTLPGSLVAASTRAPCLDQISRRGV